MAHVRSASAAVRLVSACDKLDNARAILDDYRENREQLWNLLIEAAQFEHLIMCQYLYATFSLKTEPDEGLTPGQAAASLHEMLLLCVPPWPQPQRL